MRTARTRMHPPIPSANNTFSQAARTARQAFGPGAFFGVGKGMGCRAGRAHSRERNLSPSPVFVAHLEWPHTRILDILVRGKAHFKTTGHSPCVQGAWSGCGHVIPTPYVAYKLWARLDTCVPSASDKNVQDPLFREFWVLDSSSNCTDRPGVFFLSKCHSVQPRIGWKSHDPAGDTGHSMQSPSRSRNRSRRHRASRRRHRDTRRR